MFVNLHTNSYYNFLNSTLSPQKLVDLAVQDQQVAVCLTDPNLFGATEFFLACQKAHIKPLIGLSVTVRHYEQNVNLLVIAQTNRGYQNLMCLALVKDQPDLQLEPFLDGNVVIICTQTELRLNTANPVYLAHGLSGRYPKIAVTQKPVKCQNTNKDLTLLLTLKQISQINSEHFQPLEWKLSRSLNEIQLDPPLLQQLRHQPFLSQKAAQQIFSEEELGNLQKLVEQSQWDLTKLKASSLQVSHNDAQMLSEQCKLALTEFLKLNPQLNKQLYEERLAKELEIINSLHFASYFLVVSDLVQFAHNNDILIGPGRGSAVGSLVAFLLKITQIDPVANNLIFERFISRHRQGLPDIDIDIMETKRDLVIDYVMQKYGREQCAQIVTFQKFKTRSALRDVGKVFKHIEGAEDLLGKLPKDKSLLELDVNGVTDPVLQLSLKSFRLLWEVAREIINFPRQPSIHASGVVIVTEPLITTIPLMVGNNNNYVTQVSMDWLEWYNLNKFDLLGLINLTMIHEVVQAVKPKEVSVQQFLQQIPLDDEATFTNLTNQATLGVFQLESFGMKKVLKQIKPHNLHDLAIVLALYRPGPQDNINTFIANRNLGFDTSDIDPRILPILKETYGVLIFQEQVINIAKTVANYSLETADSFRRAISKKNLQVIQDNMRSFYEGALANNFSLKAATTIFNYIQRFAGYGFNLSHALGYALLSYWTAWLKTHYFEQFNLWWLNHEQGKKEKQKQLLNEFISSGYEICPPLINKAKSDFSVQDKKLYLGFKLINGIGDKQAHALEHVQEVLKQNPNLSLIATVNLCLSKTVGGLELKDITLLQQAGCFNCFNYTVDFNLAKSFWVQSNHELFPKIPLDQPPVINWKSFGF
ncbi:DNA polymerase III subunit alpha [Mycoplasmoides pneumoniae]|uniref:DNA polymerase III subunit alpha n=1 Tax=Mycoplasmoides pneumoniae TaxID=2104 RepID=UPI001330216A|nr:DNA polymerase III subunit alpha [Mycoplasmoides pneumoniae]